MRCKCSKEGSGYNTPDGFYCTACAHNQQWYRDMQAAPHQNARDAREDARQDYLAGLEQDKDQQGGQ